MIEHRFDYYTSNDARRQAWININADLFETDIDANTVVPPTIFQRFYNLKSVIFSEFSAPSQTAIRTRSRIEAQNIDHISLALHQSGRSRVTIDGQPHDVPQQSLVVLDMGQPASAEAEAETGLGLTMPQRLLEACRGNASAWHGRIVPTDGNPLNRLLADHMRNLAACLGTASSPQRERIATATVALCNAAFLPETDSAYDRATVGMIAMRQFIDRNLGTVDAEILMAEFGLSRTPLYKLFEAEGGVYAYIRSRRLAHAMQRLTRFSDARQPSIKQLTAECGFENDQVFSRAFRRKYGLNPSEVDVSYQPYADWARTSRLMAWFKDL